MNAILSTSYTVLAFGTDLMCTSCRNIFREPAVRSALRRHFQRSKIRKTYSASSTDILTSVKQHGIYCSKDHPVCEIILGTAEMYQTGKIDENDYFHKIQHLMIEASRGKKVLWRSYTDVLLWILRGYIKYGKGFLDHLNV